MRQRSWSATSLGLAVAVASVFAGAALAQEARPTDLGAALERAGVLDSYFPEVAFDVASSLVQAAPGRWRGAQVNRGVRPGYLNIYLVDARRVPPDGLLSEFGIENFTPESLRAGALAHEASNTIFLNTAMWKRLAAATVLTQTKAEPDITAALARVDVVGLEAAQTWWSAAALAADTPVNKRVGWLMRGALAFVVAHEMGHLQLGKMAFSEPDRLRLSRMTDREKDEARACPELMERESRERQKVEQAADRAGVQLLGQQCRIGNDGQLRHAINLLGMSWYFLASMSDKLIEMGRNTDSPVIAAALRAKLGPDLYRQVVALQAAEKRRGAVAFAFPSSHPPDTDRMQAIDTALRATPCGASGMEASLMQAQLIDILRRQVCARLTTRDPTR